MHRRSVQAEGAGRQQPHASAEPPKVFFVLFGPDGSYWQSGIKLTQADWDAVDFVIWRAVHQSGKKDATFEWAKSQSLAHGKPFSAYVWAYGDPVAQAQAVAVAINDTSVPVMIDWEDVTVPADKMFRLVAELRRLGYRVPLLYTGRGFHQQMGSPILTGRGMDLVIARYGAQKPDGQYEIQARYDGMMASSTASTWDFDIGGLRPVFWQYGSRIRWGDRYMDMNAFRGSHGDLAQWFKMPGGSTTTPPPVAPPVLSPIEQPLRTYAPIPPNNSTLPLGGKVLKAIAHFQGKIYCAVYEGGYKVWLVDQPHLDAVQALSQFGPNPIKEHLAIDDPAMWRAFGPLAGPVPGGFDAHGLPV